jgi:hypothetical protein
MGSDVKEFLWFLSQVVGLKKPLMGIFNGNTVDGPAKSDQPLILDGFSTHPKYWDVYHLSTAQEYGDICGFPIPDEP